MNRYETPQKYVRMKRTHPRGKENFGLEFDYLLLLLLTAADVR